MQGPHLGEESEVPSSHTSQRGQGLSTLAVPRPPITSSLFLAAGEVAREDTESLASGEETEAGLLPCESGSPATQWAARQALFLYLLSATTRLRLMAIVTF
ncbi:unnamed protein product [Pipistrellus nathusii]|uniref:Uncharacterized protein n=1 Tax=Pipistrellus nathusii TaxID=59473 RepID=A0ABN9ZD04_PIPNA